MIPETSSHVSRRSLLPAFSQSIASASHIGVLPYVVLAEANKGLSATLDLIE